MRACRRSDPTRPQGGCPPAGDGSDGLRIGRLARSSAESSQANKKPRHGAAVRWASSMLQLKRRRLAFLLVDAWHIDDAIELTTMEMSYAPA